VLQSILGDVVGKVLRADQGDGPSRKGPARGLLFAVVPSRFCVAALVTGGASTDNDSASTVFVAIQHEIVSFNK
jgi:hypothetical protein